MPELPLPIIGSMLLARALCMGLGLVSTASRSIFAQRRRILRKLARRHRYGTHHLSI